MGRKSEKGERRKPLSTPKIKPRADLKYEPSIGRDHEHRIGQIIWRWSYVEKALDEIIWGLLHLDIAHGRHVTARQDFTHKVRIIKGIAPMKLTEEQLENLGDHLARAQELYEVRNICAHGYWITTAMQKEVFAQSLRPALPEDGQPDDILSTEMRTDYMDETIHNITVCQRALSRIIHVLPPLPGKSAQQQKTDSESRPADPK